MRYHFHPQPSLSVFTLTKSILPRPKAYMLGFLRHWPPTTAQGKANVFFAALRMGNKKRRRRWQNTTNETFQFDISPSSLLPCPYIPYSLSPKGSCHSKHLYYWKFVWFSALKTKPTNMFLSFIPAGSQRNCQVSEASSNLLTSESS